MPIVAGRPEPLQHLGNCDRARLVLEVLHDRQQRTRGSARSVQSVHGLELALAPEPDVQPAGLVVGRVRARGDLPVALLHREPGLDVVLLGRGRTKVTDRDVHDPVRQPEFLGDLLFVGQQQFVQLPRVLGQAVDEHLHLVELVHPEHALGVLAGRAGLAPEVRGEGRVPGGQIRFLEPLVGVNARQRHLGRSGEVEVVLLQVVEVRLLGRQEAGAVHGLLLHHDRRQHEQEAPRGELVDHVAVQRHLGERDVPDPVGEPGAGQPRAAGHVDPAARRAELRGVPRREPELRLLAPGPDELRVLLVHAVRRGRVGQVRDPRQQVVAHLGGLGQLVLRLIELIAQLPELLDLLRSGLALGRALLRGAQRLGALGQRSPAGVRGEQRIEVLGRAAPGQRGPEGVWILAGSLEVDHLRDSSEPAPGGALR